jgi:hypothetical protein
MNEFSFYVFALCRDYWQHLPLKGRRCVNLVLEFSSY